MNSLLRLLTLPVLALTVASATASTFTTITPDGDLSDWTGIAASYTGPSGGTININQVFIANDADYLYIRVQFVSAVNPNDSLLDPPGANSLFLAIDTDNNTNTGFNIFGSGAVGSEIGWQNDYPFDQRTGYNVGGVTGGGAGISGFASTTTEQEYRISLTATFLSDGASVFPSLGNTIRLMFWSESGDDLATPGIAYTLATAPIPEPSTFAALAGFGALTLAFFRRRR
jgi:hypothetical protein